jgi:hypothetical protein
MCLLSGIGSTVISQFDTSQEQVKLHMYALKVACEVWRLSSRLDGDRLLLNERCVVWAYQS